MIKLILLLQLLSVSSFLTSDSRQGSIRRTIKINSTPDTSLENVGKNLTLGFSQLKPFLNIAIPFFKEDAKARNSLLGVGGMTLLNTGVSVAFSYVSRDFYNALNARNEAQFYEKIELFFLALLVAIPVSVYYRFLREKLSLYWREALTMKALNLYFKDKKFYEMEILRDIDNPDQRIADDIRYFTRTSLDFFITLITSIIDLFSFSAILFQIYPGLFLAVIGYAGVGSFITSNIGRSLVALNYDRLQCEANFRFSIIRTRENSESIAFYDNQGISEKTHLWELFQEVVVNQVDIINVRRNIESFTTAYRYLVQILPSLIVAPLYFQHQIELGAISQSYGAFNHILGDFSIIINQFESISAFSAGITRLSFFFDKLENTGDKYTNYTQITTTQLSNHPDFLTGHISLAYDTSSSIYNNSTYVTGSSSSSSSVSKEFIPAISTTTTSSSSSSVHTDNHSHHRSTRDLYVSFQNVTVLTPDRKRVIVGAIPRSSPSYSSSSSTMDSNKQSPTSTTTTTPISGDSHDDIIYDGINLNIYDGDKILVVGPSGCGKSSLLRATAGLWSNGYGTITWYPKSTSITTTTTTTTGTTNAKDGIMMNSTQIVDTNLLKREAFFLPQKPYNVIGTLKEQIMYPTTLSLTNTTLTLSHNRANEENKEDELVAVLTSTNTPKEIQNSHTVKDDDEYFLNLLKLVKLDSLALRIGNGNELYGLNNVICDWSKLLSLGEQQRLAFARVLYNKPKILFLDEATSALDLQSEEAMYELLSHMNSTYISIGHRPTLLKYHNTKLILPGPSENIYMHEIDESVKKAIEIENMVEDSSPVSSNY